MRNFEKKNALVGFKRKPYYSISVFVKNQEKENLKFEEKYSSKTLEWEILR